MLENLKKNVGDHWRSIAGENITLDFDTKSNRTRILPILFVFDSSTS
jgi:hypothetical protein